MQVPEDEKYLQTKDEIIDDIIVSLGGRAAEEVIFNTVTTGAENDIEKATSMARSMITMFGMSEKFGLMQLESIQNRYLDGNRILNCSDQTAAEVDAEVKKLLAECYDRAKQIIRDHLDAMDKIAQFLIEKETITGKEFMKIYREVENIPEPTEEEMEEAKHGRIYATRAESALVGENVPIKTKENKDEAPKVEEEPSEESTETPEAKNDEQPQEAPKTEEPEAASEESTGSIFEAEVSDEGAKTSVGGGRFSHVPDDFDKN
jgi:cell division protease FtsH